MAVINGYDASFNLLNIMYRINSINTIALNSKASTGSDVGNGVRDNSNVVIMRR